MSGALTDRLGWGAAFGGATILHVALAFGATQLPAWETPPAEVAISILDLTEAVEMTGISAFSAIAALPPVGTATSMVASQSATRLTPKAATDTAALAPLDRDVLRPGKRSEPVQAAVASQNLAAVSAGAANVVPVLADESVAPAAPARQASATSPASTIAALEPAGEASLAARLTADAVEAVAGASARIAASGATGQVAAVAADRASPAQAVASSPASVAPTAAASPVAPSLARTTAAGVAQRLTASAPIASHATTRSRVTETVPSGPSTAAPDAVDTVAALPEVPLLPLPTRSEIAHLIDSFDGGDCFRATAAGTAGHPMVETLAGADAPSVRLAEAMLDHFGEPVPVETAVISAEQCRALSFLDQFHRPEASRMAMAIQHKTVASGTTLTGELAETADGVVHLLIVDDDGKIQAANGYVVVDGDDTRFTVPVVLTGAGANRPQLLLAIVAPERLQTAAEARDVLADRFFSALEFELVVKQIEVDFSVASFTVE